MTRTLWGVALPSRVDLPAAPHGVVLHWTAGGPVANPVDLKAYHYVVDHDAKVRAGLWPVAANMRPLKDPAYAHHTGGFNSYRVAVSGAGMLGYRSPREPGRYLLSEGQVRRMCEVAGYFVRMAGLDPLNPAHLCTHQEVWTIHKVRGQNNHYKLDIEWLAFKPDLYRNEVGDYLRRLTASLIPALPAESFEPPVLRRGATGSHVRTLQGILGVRGPHVFGPQTEAAVKEFQRRHGLTPDGIVGPLTWRALLQHSHT